MTSQNPRSWPAFWALGALLSLISATQGGFAGILDDGDGFGGSVTSLGDLDGDGVVDMAAAARGDDDGGRDRSAVWVLFLNTDGTVKAHQRISSDQGGFAGAFLGHALASLGDLDGDGVDDLSVGVAGDDDGGKNRGAVWVLFLDGVAACYADCDGDGELTFFDFLCFQNLFAAGDPGADCDGDGTLTFFDFLCFQNEFAAGCP